MAPTIGKAAPPIATAPADLGNGRVRTQVRWAGSNGVPLGAIALPVTSFNHRVFLADSAGNPVASVGPDQIVSVPMPLNVAQGAQSCPIDIAWPAGGAQHCLVLLLHPQAGGAGDPRFDTVWRHPAIAAPAPQPGDFAAQARQAAADWLNHPGELAAGVFPPF